MARVYSVEFENITVSGSQDFFEIAPGDDHPCVVLGMNIDQFSDMGDAQEEGLRYRIIRGYSTTGTGGSTVTPNPLDPSDAAASFTAKTNNTNGAASGTPKYLHSGAFNIRSGLYLIFPPEMTPVVNQGQGTLVVRLSGSPLDNLSMSGTLYVAEL
jgi:hypothetical protein